MGEPGTVPAEGVDTKALRLVKTEPFNSGIVILTYEPAQETNN